MQGYIKLHRQITEWEWYTDTIVKVVFLHLLLGANHKDNKWRGINIEKGQILTGRLKLASELNLSEMQIRTALKKLKSTNEITIETTSQYSIITINNWDNYQDVNQQINLPVTNKQPTNNQQITTNNNDNNDNNDNKYRERDRKILEKYLLSRKRAKPIDDIDAYISAIKPQDLEIKMQKALKWYEKQQLKQNDQITQTEQEPQESEEELKAAQKRAREIIEKARKKK